MQKSSKSSSPLSSKSDTAYEAFVGVDNGLAGAVAVVHHGGSVTALWDMPITDRYPAAKTRSHAPGSKAEEKRKKQAAKKEVDPDGIREIVEEILAENKKPLFILEKYQFIVATKDRPNKPTSPQAPIRAAWSYGIWIGILAAYKLPYVEIDPRTWERRTVPFARGEKLKSASCDEALRRFPHLKEKLVGPRGGKKDGRADAILIACYGREVHRQQKLLFNE